MDTTAELKKLIANSWECATASKELMDKAAQEENYTKATEMKVASALHSMFAARLQRIVDGNPAFESGNKGAIIEDPVDTVHKILEDGK